MIVPSQPLAPPPPGLAARPRRTMHKGFSIVGGGLGLTVFFTVALLPSAVYGGVAGVQLASGFFGMPEAPSIALNAFIVLGILSAVSAIAALFAAVGAAAGASIGALTRGAVGRRAQGPALD